jgi:hypothetical protein
MGFFMDITALGGFPQGKKCHLAGKVDCWSLHNGISLPRKGVRWNDFAPLIFNE